MPETHEATLKEERDIVERLRALDYAWGKRIESDEPSSEGLLEEAADLISQLRKRIGELEEALGPFSDMAREYAIGWHDDGLVVWKGDNGIVVGELRKARSLLGETK